MELKYEITEIKLTLFIPIFSRKLIMYPIWEPEYIKIAKEDIQKMENIKEIRKVWGVDPNIKVGSSYVIIENECGEILLQKFLNSGSWGLPGGTMQHGKSLEETAISQIKEAAGLLVSQLSLYRMFSDTVIYMAKQYFVYIKTNSLEAIELKYFSLYDLPADFQEASKCIVDAYAADHFWIGG
jgi:ADP-ribose pyrophosphatase YjhB (NUDIX family)